MIGKKINQLATELAPVSTDLTIIGDPISGVSKKITLAQLGAIFSGAVSFYTNLAGFPATGDINVIYCAKDTQKLYLWSGSAYTEVFPSQALLDTYQLRSEKGVSNGYASLDSSGKVPISQLPSSIMEYKGTWNAATNTPTLANGTGDTGDVYICNVAGTVNFGAGPITFAVGDYVVYSGTIWQRSSGAVGTVTSVAVSRSGDALAITGSPITTSGTINIGFAGTGAQYIKGDGTLATFPSIISQAQNLITEVYNNTGATLTKGTIVYINGGQGNLPTVTKALATSDATSAQTYGVVQTDITNMNNGYVVVEGRLSDLDTQAYANGTQLYLSPTTAGTWTSTKPYAPNHLVYVGIVVRSHPTQGVVEVKIMNGFEMDELHNVAAQSPDNNDILQYKTATSLWTKVAGTTSNIAEGSNLYYTDARSRAALSFTAGSGAYNSTTGVITIPTNTNQLTNGAAFITLASLSAGAGISYNNTTGVIASTITQYTDALARAAISLTTTGTSGAATYNNTTGVLNIPQYQTALTNPVTGTGTTNYLPKFTGTSSIGNSIAQDNGSRILINTGTANQNTTINASKIAMSRTSDGAEVVYFSKNTDLGTEGTANINGYDGIQFRTQGAESVKATLTASGNLGLGVTPSAWYSTVKAFQFSTTGSLWAVNGQQNTLLSTNDYIDSAATARYIANGYAMRYQQIDGAHSWSTAPSGTAGNAISFTQAMTLNASGRLLLGSTTDLGQTNGALQVTSPWGMSIINGGQALRLIRSGVNTWDFGQGTFTTQTGFGLSDVTAGITALFIQQNSGNVGIGTTSPFSTAKFQVKTTTNINLGFQTGTTDSTGFKLNAYNDDGSANIPFELNGSIMILKTLETERMRITSGGNVGIGTTSPSGKFEIASTANTYASAPAITFTDTSGDASSNRWIVGNIATTYGTFNIASAPTPSSTTYTPRLSILSNGNIGIGTTSPAYTLDVSGTGRFTSNLYTSTALYINTTAAYGFRINSEGNNGFYNRGGSTAAHYPFLLENSSGALLFQVQGTGVATFTGDVKVKTLEVTNATTYGSSAGISTYMQITVNGNNYVIPLHGTP